MSNCANTTEIPADALLAAASASLQRGAPLEARQFLHALIAQDSHHEIAFGMLASIHADSGDLPRAIECYERVLKLNPANRLARTQLSVVHLTVNDTAHAGIVLDLWSEHLTDDTDYFASCFTALASAQLGEFQKAAELARVCLQHIPESLPLRETMLQLAATERLQ